MTGNCQGSPSIRWFPANNDEHHLSKTSIWPYLLIVIIKDNIQKWNGAFNIWSYLRSARSLHSTQLFHVFLHLANLLRFPKENHFFLPLRMTPRTNYPRSSGSLHRPERLTNPPGCTAGIPDLLGLGAHPDVRLEWQLILNLAPRASLTWFDQISFVKIQQCAPRKILIHQFVSLWIQQNASIVECFPVLLYLYRALIKSLQAHRHLIKYLTKWT